MGQRWTGPDGWEVEVIRLNNRGVLRLRHGPSLIVYARTVEELVHVLALHGVDPADLVEVQE